MDYQLRQKIAQYKLAYKAIIFEKQSEDPPQPGPIKLKDVSKFVAKKIVPKVYNEFSSSDEPLEVAPPEQPPAPRFFRSTPSHFRMDPRSLMGLNMMFDQSSGRFHRPYVQYFDPESRQA
jgi:hypothetical protein